MYSHRSYSTPLKNPCEAGRTSISAILKYGNTREKTHWFIAPKGFGVGRDAFIPPC
jgi:hypothetical protein